MKKILCECCDEPILKDEEHIKIGNVYMHRECFDDNKIEYLMEVLDVNKFDLFESAYDVSTGTFEEEEADEEYSSWRDDR